jgi:4-hydroxybutyrate CoA-transferase
MKKILSVEEAVNSHVIKPGSKIYTSGNAATPRILLLQLAADLTIKDVDFYGVLLLGEKLHPLFSEERCASLTHRVLFSSYLSRGAVNKGWAKYHPMHLSEIPRIMRSLIHPNVALISVSGPDQGGNYSLGTTVEGVLAAVMSARKEGGVVIAERNEHMPFVLGTTIPESWIDYMIDVSYPLPGSPTPEPDQIAGRIGEIIAAMYIKDGSGDTPGSTLQYGIGAVPEAVTAAILKRGYKDLGIHTELFADAMQNLHRKGVVTNRWKKGISFSESAIFLSQNQEGYDWLHYNSSVQSRPSDYTNSVFTIAQQPNMVTINSAIGVDLHGNIWADSLDARKIYSGVGGQSDFIRGAQYAEGGVAIIALKSTTADGISKVVDRAPAGITYTATPSDSVILVTEYGAFDPRGLSLGERAVGIANLARPEERERLLKVVFDHPAFHKPKQALSNGIAGFVPYEKAIMM